MQVQKVCQDDTVGRLVRYEVSGGSAAAPLVRALQLQHNDVGLLPGRSDVGNLGDPAHNSGATQPQGMRSVSGLHVASCSEGNSVRLITEYPMRAGE